MSTLKELFLSYGIDTFGICSFSSVEDRLLNCRAKQRIPENSKSVICAALPYLVEKNRGNISRYAAVPDYHIVFLDILKEISQKLKEIYPDFEFEPFVDNSPIPEVYVSALSGLGVVGKNGLLITEKYGSWVFLGTIVTNLEIEMTETEIKSCIGCNKCLSVCPSGLEKATCLSHITQKKGELSEFESDLMKKNNTAWGCDICQEVCPMNKEVNYTENPLFLKGYVPDISNFPLPDRAYNYRGKAVLERNINILK